MRGRAATIYLGQTLPPGSSGQPGDGPGTLSPLLGLAPNGVCPASDVTTGAVSSYLAISPLSARGGRYVSVALSVGSPRPAVSGHPTRRSSDFPPSPLAAASHSEERLEETRGTAAARPPCAVPIVPSQCHRRHLLYPPRATDRLRRNRFDHPPGSLSFDRLRTGLARKGSVIRSEGHPFDYAQGKLSDSGPSAGSGQAPGLRPSAHPIFQQPAKTLAPCRRRQTVCGRAGPAKGSAPAAVVRNT